MKPATTKSRFTLDDLCKTRSVYDPKVAPDGKNVVFGVFQRDGAANTNRDTITLFNLDSKSIKSIAEGGSHDWSPDGREVAFENTDGMLAVYDMEMENIRTLCKIEHSAHFINHWVDKGLSWSPDGRHIAFVSSESAPGETDSPKAFREVNRILYKTKGGSNRPYYNDNRLSHIYIVPRTGGTPECLTPSPFNEHSITWSPDGQKIAFISNRTSDPDNNQHHALWTVDIKTKSTRQLTQNNESVFTPQWSPDGRHIAFLATVGAKNNNDSMAENTQLYLLPAHGGQLLCLTGEMDRNILNFRWHPNSGSLYFTIEDEGTSKLYRVSISNKGKTPIIPATESKIDGFSTMAQGDDIIYVKSSQNNPTELYLYQATTGESEQLTRFNRFLAEKRLLQSSKTFWFNSFDGTKIQAWLTKPVHFKSNTTYPLILVIHGGPHNMFGYEFDEKLQVLAAAGFGVLQINPRGSDGYGQEFKNGNLNDWGGGDYEDLMAGLNLALKNNKWIDREKLGVTGQSYGGYLTNWIITKTKVFKAAVSDGGISNLISFSGTSVIHSLLESEFGEYAPLNYDALWKCSPLRNASAVQTPTLFLHGETDNEVPLSQSEEMYMALKKMGVATSLIMYCGEGHGWRPDLRPKNRQNVYERMIEWFHIHFQGKSPSTP
ncbi:S9 family peptidase [Pseudozobellia thermophila]|uniref:Dipeptidyl aminopeptidase/acylaminoacyl peptidase n=1 Tax=Pseudozobellia thermophila TaxID=192903 RepID=A0A1M6NMS2_9FLAO|nr:S9 family peptidase [Pseudozobellia thermophila]SHJ96862.1 Dipeptidyl aminopeptidase/acylaminoacyl peptidase [Pseudozobellia thermophila]